MAVKWFPSAKEIDGVLQSAPDKRYRYFVNKVADKGAAYTLRDGAGWLLYGDQEHRELVPLWPHAAFAERSRSSPAVWVEQVPLSELVEFWLPGMANDGRWAAVFPIGEGDVAVARDARDLARDLAAEIAKFT